MFTGKSTVGWYIDRRNWGLCLYTDRNRNPVLSIAVAGPHAKVGSRYWDTLVLWWIDKKAKLKARYGR